MKNPLVLVFNRIYWTKKFKRNIPTQNLRIWWLRVRPRPGASGLALMNENPHLDLIRLLLARLERISVDSYWAHRASGVRGTLLRVLDQTEKGLPVSEYPLHELIEQALLILSISAQEQRKVTKSRKEGPA
jgi:hypothetical protein